MGSFSKSFDQISRQIYKIPTYYVAKENQEPQYNMANHRVIFFDLETTGIDWETQHEGIQICSIFASIYVKEGEPKTFLAYIKPTCEFQPDASKVNGMSMSGDGHLVKRGTIVRTALHPNLALRDFLEFIEAIKDEEGEDTTIVLTAHNSFNFDAVVLKKNLRDFGLPPLPKGVLFSDTCDRNVMKMAVERKIIPDRNTVRKNYALDTLLNHFFGDKQGNHDAVDDTVNLIRVANRLAFKLDGYDDYETFLRRNRDNIEFPSLIRDVSI